MQIMKSVYIFLTRTNTLLSRAIHAATDSSYTHAAISLDRNLTRMYSFGRKIPQVPFLAGLIQEDIHNGVYYWNSHMPCAIYKLTVDAQVYAKIEQRIEEMLQEQNCYHYNITGVFLNFFHKEYSKPYSYFCSEFVADTLIRTGAVNIGQSPSRIRPNDFSKMSELSLIYSGPIKDSVATNKTKSFMAIA